MHPIRKLYQDISQKKAEAIRIRQKLIKAIEANAEVNEMICDYLGFKARYNYAWELGKACKLFRVLAPEWRLHRIEELPEHLVLGKPLNLIRFCRRDDETVIREGKKLSQRPGMAILALLFQIHIERMDRALADIKSLQKKIFDFQKIGIDLGGNR